MMGPLAKDELAELVASGENSYVEFKDARVANRELSKEMCAFANADGGRILIGVGDEGTELHDAGDWSEERVMNLARTSIDPPIVPTYQRLRWGQDRAIAIVGIDLGVEKPYALKDGESRRYYLRVGSTSREASREELVRLTQASGSVASDLRPVLGASLDDLDAERVSARFAGRRTIEYAKLDVEERRRILADAEILHEESGCPTIAGLLCFGLDPQAHLPYAELTCVSYPGEEPGREIVDRANVGGRVDEQIESAVGFIRRNIASGSNAVAHRHYGIQGPAQVRVYSNRIEVTSPGEPPNGVTPDSMRVGVSVRRNQFLVQYLLERGLIDALGRGVVLLYEDAAELGLAPPTIVAEHHLTAVTLSLERASG